MRILAIAAALLLTGCSWRYGTQPLAVGGKPVDIVCPDPPPVKPDAIVGSTPCVLKERR